jgi:hypothetical protein
LRRKGSTICGILQEGGAIKGGCAIEKDVYVPI